MSLTVIIPTYNRKDILKKCINAIIRQTYLRSDYEVIIVDDGSTDGTEGMISSTAHKSPVLLRYFKQDNKGPAAARNVGIKNANGRIFLFIGDDIIIPHNFLEEHMGWHRRYPDDNIAVLGYITWSPEIVITPFMRWLENGGPQFSFCEINDKVEVDGHKYFYSSNISLKKEFLLENKEFFDEEFPYAAFEDIELGYRLKKRGLILKYNKNAIAYHYHPTSLKSACLRMIRVGESSQILGEKMGGGHFYYSNKLFLRNSLRKIKFIIYYLLSKFYERRLIKKNIFGYVIGYYWCIGIERYKRQIK